MSDPICLTWTNPILLLLSKNKKHLEIIPILPQPTPFEELANLRNDCFILIDECQQKLREHLRKFCPCMQCKKEQNNPPLFEMPPSNTTYP